MYGDARYDTATNLGEHFASDAVEATNDHHSLMTQLFNDLFSVQNGFHLCCCCCCCRRPIVTTIIVIITIVITTTIIIVGGTRVSNMLIVIDGDTIVVVVVVIVLANGSNLLQWL